MSRSDLAVLGGVNAALVEWADGWELLQFANAELVSEGRYRLSRLLRGQQGTEWVMAGVAGAGARVLFLTGAEARADVSVGEVGAELVWRAWRSDPAEATGWEEDYRHEGMAQITWSPAHLRSTWEGGDLRLNWVRRARKGGDAWSAGEPPNEISESYEVVIRSAGTVLRRWTVAQPESVYPEAAIAADFPGGGAGTVEVAQIGPFATGGRVAVIEIVAPSS